MESVSNRVLLVSDDPDMGQLWADALRSRGIDIVISQPDDDTLDQWEQDGFDLAIIDVDTHLDRVGICRQLRARAVNPVLVLAPRFDESYLLEAYRAGSDECVLKPVGPAVLVAKVHAWLRHRWTVRIESLEPLEGGGILLEPHRRQVIGVQGTRARLTALEFRLLHLLMSHPGQVLPAEAIISQVWGYDRAADKRALWAVVSRLRHKIEPDPHHPRIIRTMAGQGYTFADR
jgi:DNA-binding response OmpR family regulator